MRRRGLFATLLARLLPLDLLLSVTMTIGWLSIVGVRELAPSVVLVSVVCGARIVVWIAQLAWLLRPLELGADAISRRDDPALLAATLAIDALPTRFALRYCIGWLGYVLVVVALAWFVFTELLTLGQSELVGVALQLLTAVLGPWMFAYPLVHRVVEPMRLDLVSELDRRGIDRRRPPSSLVHVIIGMIMGLVFAPSCWLAAQLLVVEGEAARERALLEAEHGARWAARAFEVDGQAALEGGATLVTRAELPPTLAPALAPALVDQVDQVSFVDARREQASAAAAVGDGRFVVVTIPVERGRTRLWIGLITCGLAILVWSLLAIQTVNRSLLSPLASLRDRLRLTTKVAAGPASLRMAVARSDEVGELITAFNQLLDELEAITEAANAVAAGDLRVELSGEDHLRVVFRGMVDRLADMVAPVRIASAEIAATAAAIDETSRGQGVATRQQVEGVNQVELAMQRLAASTEAISEAVTEVLGNAEQTRERADLVVGRTLALSDAIEQVRQRLEQIDEVAERSDLLALNGSLEATRAGEAGRGFALVAAEMRRLAERVSDTVVDVRRTLAEVGSSHAATAAATRDSRELAEHTTTAARRIFEVSRAQTQETERVVVAVKEVVGIIEASEAAAGRTQAATEGLREQARRLADLLERFDVDA